MLIIFRGSDWQTLVFIGVFLGKSKVFLKMSGVFRGTDPGTDRDRRATSRLGGGGGGGHISDSILGGTRHFFLLTLYNFKNTGGHIPPHPPPLLRGP